MNQTVSFQHLQKHNYERFFLVTIKNSGTDIAYLRAIISKNN